MCRAGQGRPDTFGIFNMHGLWFVRGDFARDVAALNKVEMLPWIAGAFSTSRCGAVRADYTFLDQVAELTSGDVPEFDKVRLLYEEDERLRVPGTIRSYTQAGCSWWIWICPNVPRADSGPISRVRPLFAGFDYSLSLQAAIEGSTRADLCGRRRACTHRLALTVEGYLLAGSTMTRRPSRHWASSSATASSPAKCT